MHDLHASMNYAMEPACFLFSFFVGVWMRVLIFDGLFLQDNFFTGQFLLDLYYISVVFPLPGLVLSFLECDGFIQHQLIVLQAISSIERGSGTINLIGFR